jgi:hypothetical protein
MERKDVHGVTDTLLFDIYDELRKLNEKLTPIKEESKAVPTSVPCKYCGGTHDNKGQLMACARKSKREGAK